MDLGAREAVDVVTAPAKWIDVHIGDTVQGADGAGWRVTAREPGPTWLSTGIRTDFFSLMHTDGRTVRAARPLHEPAGLAARADHREMAAACQALLDAGFSITPLGEGTVSATAAATADPFTPAASSQAIRRDRFGRYLLPDPTTGEERAWTRVTTVARTLSDEYNLTAWKLRMAVKGIALRPDLIAAAAASDVDSDKGNLNGIAEKAMERAGAGAGANLGTALHAFTHRLIKGETVEGMGVPQSLRGDIDAYRAALKSHGLGVSPLLSERIVVLPELGVAGTFDNLVTQPAGNAHAKPFGVLDLKTGKSLEYSWLEIAIQEAFYSRASHMWDPDTQTYIPMPTPQIDQDRGLVLHLPVGQGRAAIYAVNLTKGWEAAQLAMKVRELRSGAKSLAWLVSPADPAVLLTHRVRIAPTVGELARLWEKHHPAGEWTEEVNAAAQQRATELSDQLALQS